MVNFATTGSALWCCLPLECENAANDVSFVIDTICLEAHIFLDEAVMSLEALMMRSRRSWCSSSSARNPSNMDMIGDEPVVLSCASIAACGRLTPIGVMWDNVRMVCSSAGSCCLMLLVLELTSEFPFWDAARFFRVARHDASCCATPRPVYSKPTPLHLSALVCRSTGSNKKSLDITA